jgi:alkanesulfonate monooxygenase SsuD/methylene tetrahydromethanopterin reductase-like flavin-dependent oxidoreductase (luciferase family)
MEVWIRQSMPYHCQDDAITPYPVPGWMWDRARGEQLYADRMRFIRRVDQLGYDGIIFTEHHYGPNGGLTPSPTVMLAAATQVTEQIKLVTMGISLALYPQPVRVAEELAMVDNLSHGRLVVGFISSGGQNLYAYNIPVAEERGRYHEAYDLIVKAWTEENPFAWHGEHYDYECVSILPRPLQAPHPEVWTTGTAAETIQWAADKRIRFVSHGPTDEVAERLAYYRQYAEAECGWTPEPRDVGMAREFFIGPTREKVESMIDEVFAREQASSYPFIFEHPKLAELERERYKVRSYDYLSAKRAFRGAAWNAAGIASGQFLVGDPDTLTEQILVQRQATSAGVLIIRPELGDMGLQEVGDGLELFAREVLPVLRRA